MVWVLFFVFVFLFFHQLHSLKLVFIAKTKVTFTEVFSNYFVCVWLMRLVSKISILNITLSKQNKFITAGWGVFFGFFFGASINNYFHIDHH